MRYIGKPKEYSEIKDLLNLDDDVSKVDVFMSSKLNEEQLIEYKAYENSRKSCSEFLITYLNFDKVSHYLRHIVTTCDEPHVRFFNYYLMDWGISNPEFPSFDSDMSFRIHESSEEKEAREQIEEIRSKVYVKDRKMFFK